MYCRFCGAEVGSEHKHCRKCGAEQPADAAANGNASSRADGFAAITYVFIGVCFLLMFVAGLKMLGDDNYPGLILVVLGFGSLIYGSFWWQSRRADRPGVSRQDSFQVGDSEDAKRLASGERFGVTEQTTKKLDRVKLREDRQRSG